jgi:hypothetical protein
LKIHCRERLHSLIEVENKTTSDSVAVSRARAKLSRDLGTWRKTQLQRYPKLHNHIPLIDFTTPEDEHLQLPSAFTPEMCRSLGLGDLGTVEYSLREGQAYDALSSLRQVIQEYNYNLLDKKHSVHGVAAGIRAGTFLRVLTSDKRSSANKYRRARNALIALGLPQTDARWRELHDDELWGKNVSTTRTMGDSQKRDPWFWHVVQPSDLSTEQQTEWSIDSAS